MSIFIKEIDWNGKCPFCSKKENFTKEEIGHSDKETDYRLDCPCGEYFYISYPR